MTTLHGLMTISEIFAGFNLINTGVLNCLIMCQNYARKIHHSVAKKNQNIFWVGVQWGGGHPLTKPTSHGACGTSILVPSLPAPKRKSWIRQ